MPLFVKGTLGDAKATDIIRRVARLQALVAVGQNLYEDLVTELGTDDKAIAFLVFVATDSQKPIALHLNESKDSSYTFFIGPKSWPNKKLEVCVAAHAKEIEQAFGKIDYSVQLRPD